MHTSRNAQTGAALLAAMLTVTLVASFAAAAMWQQWRSIEIETAERTRTQSAWILVGALDWARLILREDARSGGADHLAEPWAVPLQESRLSTFLAADKNNTVLAEGDAGNEVFLSGQVIDMQSRLNVLNLVQNRVVHPATLASFTKLFNLLNLELDELDVLANNLRVAKDDTLDKATSDKAPLEPQRIDQLIWLGLSASTLDRIRPYITVLPVRTPVNLNTASAEVLYAAIAPLDLDGARRLVAARERQHFRNLPEVASQLNPAMATQINSGEHGIASNYFEVRGRLRLGEAIIEEHSLVSRNGLNVKTEWRERGSVGEMKAGVGASIISGASSLQ